MAGPGKQRRKTAARKARQVERRQEFVGRFPRRAIRSPLTFDLFLEQAINGCLRDNRTITSVTADRTGNEDVRTFTIVTSDRPVHSGTGPTPPGYANSGLPRRFPR
jgi:hypothetical protein